MDFLKNNKTLVGLAVAIILAILGMVFKVDVPALLTSVGTIDKQITTLEAPVAPAADPAPATPAQ